jgi:hypothetical protein
MLHRRVAWIAPAHPRPLEDLDHAHLQLQFDAAAALLYLNPYLETE